MQAAYVERIKALEQLAASVPQEAAELDARIERLRRKHGRSCARTGACGLSTDCTRQHCCKVQEHVVGVRPFRESMQFHG